MGCVMFEVVSLYPLFPGANELDQMSRIHAVMGTPPPELLAKLKKRSAHMSFDFPAKEGTGEYNGEAGSWHSVHQLHCTLTDCMVAVAAHTWWLLRLTHGGCCCSHMVAVAAHTWWLLRLTHGGCCGSHMVAVAAHTWWLL